MFGGVVGDRIAPSPKGNCNPDQEVEVIDMVTWLRVAVDITERLLDDVVSVN